MRDFGGVLFQFSFLQFGDLFNETIIRVALVEYEMIIASSYPKRARGKIVNSRHLACLKCTGGDISYLTNI